MNTKGTQPMNGMPGGAVRVRADEVRPGDQLVVDGEVIGAVMQSDQRLGSYSDEDWYLYVDNGAGRTECVRHCTELVWVVRPEPTVTLTITLPERSVRACASDTLAASSEIRPALDALDAAAREWVAANPQDGDR